MWRNCEGRGHESTRVSVEIIMNIQLCVHRYISYVFRTIVVEDPICNNVHFDLTVSSQLSMSIVSALYNNRRLFIEDC